MYQQDIQLLAQVLFLERQQEAETSQRRQHRQNRRPLRLGIHVGNILVAAGRRLQALDAAQPAPATQQ